MTNPAYEATNSDVEKLIAQIKVDIDKRKSMPPRGDANSNIERLRVMNDTMKSFSTESVEELIAALEQAQQENKERSARIEELESQRQLAFMACNRWRDKCADADKRIAELEAAPNGMMQLSNELAEMKPVKLPSAWIEPGNRWLQERDVIEAIRAAGGTVAGGE
jgi:hypothetical protein